MDFRLRVALHTKVISAANQHFMRDVLASF